MKNLIDECVENNMFEEAEELMKINNESILGEIPIRKYIDMWRNINKDFVSPANEDWVNGFIAGFEMARKSS